MVRRPVPVKLALAAIVPLSTAGLVLAVAPASAEAARAAVGAGDLACGATVTASVTLTGDLDCAGDALRIEGPGVVVDLGGHTVTSAGACPHPLSGCSVTLAAGSDGSTLKNGTVIGGGISALAPGLTLSTLTTFNAVVRLFGNGDQLLDSTLIDGDVSLTRNDQVFSGNWVSGGSGVHIDNLENAVINVSITKNIVALSSGAGIWNRSAFFAPGGGVTGEIRGNILYRNAGSGIRFDGKLQELGAISIAANWSLLNGGDGITLTGTPVPPPAPYGGPVTLTGNITQDNTGRGIDAGWIPGQPTGAVDGGGNTASGNTLTPSCIGVAC